MTRRLLGIVGRVGAATVLVASCLSVAMAGAAGSGPAFVQQTRAHALNVTSLKLTPGANVTSGNRLVVQVGVWSGSGVTASSVTDAAGNTYTELLHFKASDATEMSVWTAPITGRRWNPPDDHRQAHRQGRRWRRVLEYAGLSERAGRRRSSTRHLTRPGQRAGAATVASGATAPTSAGNELAIGIYVDSGFGDHPTAGAGYHAAIQHLRRVGHRTADRGSTRFRMQVRRPTPRAGTGPPTRSG